MRFYLSDNDLTDVFDFAFMVYLLIVEWNLFVILVFNIFLYDFLLYNFHSIQCALGMSRSYSSLLYTYTDMHRIQ